MEKLAGWIKFQEPPTIKQEVLAKFAEDRQTMTIIQQRRHHCIVHILRHQSLLLDNIEKQMKGRPKGRRRTQMLHMLTNDGYVAVKRETEDRRR